MTTIARPADVTPPALAAELPRPTAAARPNLVARPNAFAVRPSARVRRPRPPVQAHKEGGGGDPCSRAESRARMHAVSAVNEGYSISSSVMRSPIGGRLLTDALHHCLASKGTNVQPWYTYRQGDAGANGRGATASHTAWAAGHLLADIKECSCRVSETPFQEDENQNMPPQSYELPDGSVVAIGVERFKIPEIMFNPVRAPPHGMRPMMLRVLSMRSRSGVLECVSGQSGVRGRGTQHAPSIFPSPCVAKTAATR